MSAAKMEAASWHARALVAFVTGVGAFSGTPRLVAQDAGIRDAGTAVARNGDAREMTFALTGDAIITRRLSVYDEPDFLEMIELIRGADAAFTNLEVLFHDYEPYPAHQ
ncbi:MAG: hypothetical protein GWN79_13540, partial [Actinobacteria bacterium]|nr:hypothetical protein [Actinomycetota bacterium]NIY09822.1 hypothetical protein [Gemmatimonadota bacterium]NIU20046.1 hypothetical protein [Actinomycetota bacterium]NIV56495.1 hypothetical protein [Actinomycetota bacterium]NIV87995.1 hypothetical protein [Actinomycetota bacterium]